MSINTVTKLLEDAGETAWRFTTSWCGREVAAHPVRRDLVVLLREGQNVATAKAAPEGAGDVWTWTALDADTKLMCSWMVGQRDAEWAEAFLQDLRERIDTRVQLTTDGHHIYLGAVEKAFGDDVDFAMLVKIYGEAPKEEKRYSPAICLGAKKTRIEGDPDMDHVSTSYVERQNLQMRMSMRRFTRLTNAHSKKLNNHRHAISLYFTFYNWTRIHRTLRITPAMAAGSRITCGASRNRRDDGRDRAEAGTA